MLSILSFISVTSGSFKNSFQKYSSSSFFKEAFDAVFSLILEVRLLQIGIACALKESEKLIVLSYIER